MWAEIWHWIVVGFAFSIGFAVGTAFIGWLGALVAGRRKA